MKLMRATTALKKYFLPGEIDIRSLIAAIERGDVPGRVWRNGGRIQAWVDADRFEGCSTGNKLADGILEKLKAPARAIASGTQQRPITNGAQA